MAELRYKAFISYSHQDRKWAQWLHRSLESYRVPRKLVGREGTRGAVPSRVSPVFRDREELPTSPDLSERITEALEASESLIVICSPAAAASRWVNEEVRHFQALGRADRIFCVIVDGDPVAAQESEACFPPALRAGVADGHGEPLAADLRKWADGKSLSKLKLVAGLLGLRLDELRRRDLMRQRKRRVAAGVGAAALAAVVAMAVLSRMAEVRQREQAEQLAGFIVGMNEDLKSEVSLNTLERLADRMYGYLETIDERHLTPETRKQVALVVRSLGRVRRDKNQLAEALAAFQRSRDELRALSRTNPKDPELLFEWSQAEFYVGDVQQRQGDLAGALDSMQRYQQAAGLLVERDAGNPAWLLELAFAYTNVAVIRLMADPRFAEQSVADFQQAIGLIERVLQLDPDNRLARREYPSALGWAADAQASICDLEGALASRRKGLEAAREAARADSANNDLRRRHAFALTGLAVIQRRLGRSDEAVLNLSRARDILDQLSQVDPSNQVYRQQVLRSEWLLASLIGEIASVQEARTRLRAIEAEYRKLLEGEPVSGPHHADFIDYLMVRADFEHRTGSVDNAASLLEEAIRLLQRRMASAADPRDSRRRMDRARVQWWTHFGERQDMPFPVDYDVEPPDPSLRSCEAADLAARIYVMEGDRDNARERISYLTGHGYADPGFIGFCARHDLCSE